MSQRQKRPPQRRKVKRRRFRAWMLAIPAALLVLWLTLTNYVFVVRNVEVVGSESLPADAVILACGGLSYPATGSDGGGFRIAEDASLNQPLPFPFTVNRMNDGQFIFTIQGFGDFRSQWRDRTVAIGREIGTVSGINTDHGKSPPFVTDIASSASRSPASQCLSS